ncbi:hypothetical protein JCM5350_002503 [Sporobolomyces pararoseus]
MSVAGPALLRPRSLTEEETKKLKEFNIPTLYERFADHLIGPLKEFTIPSPRPQLVSLQSTPHKWSDHGLGSVQAIDDPELAGLDCNFSIVIGGAGVLLDFVRDPKRTVGNSMARPVSLPLQARAAVGEGNTAAIVRQANWTQLPLKYPSEKDVLNSSASDDNDPLQVLSRGALSSPDISYFRVDITEKEDTILSGIVRVVTVPEGESCRPWSVNDEIVSLYNSHFSRKEGTHSYPTVQQQSFPPLSSVLHGVEAPPTSPHTTQPVLVSGESARSRDDRSRSPSRRSRSRSRADRQRTPEGRRRGRSPPPTSAASLSRRKQGIYGFRSARTF